MNKIKYTNFLLTIIAMGIIGINIHFFKDELISVAHAFEYHTHDAYDIYGLENHDEYHTHDAYDIYGLEDHEHDHDHDTYDIYDFKRNVKNIIQNCYVDGDFIYC